MSYKSAGYRKRKRDRDTNWSNTEKQFLQNFAADHRAVLDDRGNDTEMINKKNDAWRNIMMNMHASGFYRNINKLKQQWRRIKLDAKKRKLPLMVPNTVSLLSQKIPTENINTQRLMIKSELNGFSMQNMTSNHHSIFYASSENGSDIERATKPFNVIDRIQPKRYRSANWTPEEKQLLFQYIKPLREIIDDKRNDTVMQAKKRDAWMQIQNNMVASGYVRDVLKYKEQWVRMKFQKGHRPSVISANSTGSASSVQLSESSSVLTNETEIDIKPEIGIINPFLPSQNVSCEIGIGYDHSNSNQDNHDESSQQQQVKVQHNSSSNNSNNNSNNNNNSDSNQNNNQNNTNNNYLDCAIDANDLKKKEQNFTNVAVDCGVPSDTNHIDDVEEKNSSKTYQPPQNDEERSSELHRYRIAVEKRRLKLLDIQMRQEQMLFQKEYEIKVFKLEMMKKYKETP